MPALWRNPNVLIYASHTPFVSSDITIDLTQLNEITVSKDKTKVPVGTGNRWRAVNHKLNPLNVPAPGSRISGV